MLLNRNRVSSHFVLGVAVTFACLVQGIGTPPLDAQDSLPARSGGAAVASATDPVVVVTIGSVNKLMQDVNYITGVVGQPQVGGMFAMMAGTFTQGIDMNQPIAVVVPLVNGSPEPIALLPTADVKTVLKRLEAQTGPADELSDGTLVIAVGANTVYIRQLGNWAALARNRELLDLAPADPSSVMEGMGNSYDLAIRLRMQQVPTETRNMLIAQLRQGFEQAIAKQDQADAEGTRAMAESSIKQIEQLIQDTNELKIGWNIDQSAKGIHIDGAFTAVDGSQLAAIYGGQKAIPSQFASVIRDDAAAFYHAAMSIGPEAIEQYIASLETATAAINNAISESDDLNEDQQVEVQALVGRIVDLATSSVKEGKADFGTLLLANEDDFQFVFGSFVADGNEAAQIVKDLAAKLQNEPKAPRFLFDQETYKGVSLHRIEADVPAGEDEARKVFGETLRVHVGTGAKAVYVAVGENSESLMKQLVDSGASDNGGVRPLGQMTVKLLPILKYAQSIETNGTIAAMIDSLATAADQGNVRIVSNSIPNGQDSRITVTEGLLQAIGAAVRQTQQAKMQQNDQF
ncbi:hypothetical protein [Novipirellula artificiosorum]|uniref:Uncharacterized protein n=1 Tax=Novipirellula artificiosorum TaxID=2528016 RepID=A0A5C6DXD0_9BACT|nr:hypothetical protein [Novipirellula artificiosorum]TWU40874.1 hypothetical protein Poly41_17090 [Novipirellula artificiosorum]